MSTITLLIFLIISSVLYGQDKVYVTYKTKNGMGIQLTYDGRPADETQVRVTSKEYEFIDAVYIPEKAKGLSKMHFRFRDKGKMGILNVKGKVIIPAIYDTIE